MATKLKATIFWTLKNFSSFQSASIYSDQFVVGGCKWRLLAFPKGSKKSNYLSLHLDVPDKKFLPIGWRRHAKVSLTVVNQFSEKLSQLAETQQWFDQNAPNWGFSEMITLTELNANKGFLVNGELKIVAKVEVLEVVGELDVSEEPSPIMETVDVNGFQILPSHDEDLDTDETVNINGFWICRSHLDQAKLIFKEHPETASNFCLKSVFAKETYLTVLLHLIDNLNRLSLQSLPEDELKEADDTIFDLEAAGFKLDWLKKKLEEIRIIIKKVQDRAARMGELERQILEKMHELVVLEDKMKKEQLESKSDELVYYFDIFI